MKKLALLIGINYQNSFRPLKGCINDVKGLSKLLVEKFNFSFSDIQILFEEAATRENILNGLDYLVKELQSGDIGILSFHGHGTQVADKPPMDEEDLLDEVIVPYDALDDTNKYPENFIRDDEIRERLSNLPQNVHFTFIFDSCHSGTVTRNINNELTTRSLPPSVSVTAIKQLMAELKTSRSLPEKEEVSYYTLSACKPEQEAKDDESNGYLTAELLRYIEPGITYEQLKEKVVSAVKERSLNQQEPVFEVSNPSLPIFGVTNDFISPAINDPKPVLIPENNNSKSLISPTINNNNPLIGREIKVFGIDITPHDITLGSDGSVIIRNPLLSTIVGKAYEKNIKNLVENPSRALDTNILCGNNIFCAV